MARLRRAKAAKCPFRVIVDRGNGGGRWKWVEENDDKRREKKRERERALGFATREASRKDEVVPFTPFSPYYHSNGGKSN